MDISSIHSLIKSYSNHKKGVTFYDLMPVYRNPEAFNAIINKLEWELQTATPHMKIVVPETRGIVLGAALADRLKVPLIIARKPGRLPGKVIAVRYQTEYSNEVLEIQRGVISKGDSVLVVDDVLATGGTLKACIDLIEKSGGVIYRTLTVLKIASLSRVASKNLCGYQTHSLLVV